MTYKVPKVDPNAPVILIDIGNTNIDMATWLKRELRTPLSVPIRDKVGFETAFNAHLEAIPKGNLGAVAVASVAPESLARVREQVRSMTNRDPLVVGDRIPLPLEVDVKDARAVGVDRVCAAAAVFEKLQKTCVVVCFGTAVTVDLIADDGTFLGGAILPGLRLQFRSLHEHTAQLPDVSAAVPETLYGRDTVEAIQTGVCRGLAGAVRGIVEGYATSLNFWPQVVATGGDLAFMSPLCDFIDTQVNHLVLRGVGLAYTRFMAERDAT